MSPLSADNMTVNCCDNNSDGDGAIDKVVLISPKSGMKVVCPKEMARGFVIECGVGTVPIIP